MVTPTSNSVWYDQRVRGQALEGIIDAWQQGDQGALNEALRRVDEAVAAGLQECGLPRGPVSSLEFAAREGRWLGQKQPACKLCLDAVGFHEAITRRRLHDDAFRTWVHESIHARQHFTSEQQRAEHNWPGYEEGLAEGLARLLTGHMDIRRVSFNVYIMQYETLAAHLNISVELLWRALWRYGPGQVRHHCPDVINQIVRQSAQGQLNPAKLRACCDQVFARRYLHDRTAIDDDGARSGMAQRWRRLLSWANTT